MNRMEQTERETKAIFGHLVAKTSVEITMLDCQFFPDKELTFFADDSIDFKMAAGRPPLNKWLDERNLVKTSKKEATSFLIHGLKNDTGCWISKATKNIWLKPK